MLHHVGYRMNAFVDDLPNGFTLAHELAHLLGDESHEQHPLFEDANDPNLLRNGTTTNTVGGSKRLTNEQETRIYNNPVTHAP